jgi:hypothetical protein
MMFKPRTAFTLIGLASVAALALAQDVVPLARAVKVGDTAIFATKLVVDMSGNKVTITGKSTEKVVKIEENGDYHVEIKYSETKAVSKNGETDQSQDPDVVVFRKNGEVARLLAAKIDPSMIRIANMTALVLPVNSVKIGDTWMHAIVADAKTGAVAATANYKVTGREKVGDFDCLNVQLKYAETEGNNPATCEGMLWIDLASGTLVKCEAVMKNLPTPFATVRQGVNATLSVIRVVPAKETTPPADATPPDKVKE